MSDPTTQAGPVSPSRQQGPAPMPQERDYFNVPLDLVNTRQFYDVVVNNMGKFSANEFVDTIKYQGFERVSFLINAARRMTPSQILRLAIIGAIRGANMEKIVVSSQNIDADIKTLHDTGVIKRRAKGSNDITVLRCTAAVPQWCAYFLGQASVVKKLPNMECPGNLQFPAAASLPMSKELRIQHIKFSMQFSRVIKGEFNENIYMTMMNNLIPRSEIPDTLLLQLGVEDTTLDIPNCIENARRELGIAAPAGRIMQA